MPEPETLESPMSIEKRLQSLPRRERAREQGQQWLFRINDQLVIRKTRRYWSVSGNDVKLKGAIELLS